MVRKNKGFHRRTRRKLKKGRREKFKVTPFIKRFGIGQRVVIDHLPYSLDGMPHPRFKGRSGVIRGIRGNAYIVEIRDGDKIKNIISNPEHLKAA
ncbi:MAG TPA: 50S ribosomal protein L21e [Candidatus Aenigmarchaeota archaeon]|nr:MAG: 50S ribosomal protein L21e [Candidatus Aenigmarchaeota archaeon]HDD46117.1 50S ribosomal protein L21e [Candidatus Aenigmarchaeota archaeon]